MNVQDEHHVQDETREEVAHWVQMVARAGYFAKGTVYLTVGVLTARAAVLAGVQAAGTRNSLATIGTGAFGRSALAIVALGLAGYAVWQLVRAVVNPERYKVNAKGVVKRVGLTLSSFAYFGLAYFCALLALFGQAAGTQTSEDDWTARILSWPLGAWLIAGFGVILIAVAFNGFYVAFSAAFMKRIKLEAGEGGAGDLIKRAGQFGIAARGVVLLIVAYFFVDAAWEDLPQRAGGLGEALRLVENAPLGPLVLGVIAAGLIAFGVYELLRGRYRRVPVDPYGDEEERP